jgi:hypothetical protein
MKNPDAADPGYVFGPLPTRRLGWSLGIDTVPAKTCNWNCVYCQLGRTHPLTNVRKAYLPESKILAALRRMAAVLARIKPDEVHVTLPTRCPVEPWVRPPTPARVRRAEVMLGARAKTKLPGRGTRGDTGAEELVGVVTRHPLRRTDLARLLPGWTQGRLTRHLRRLRAAGRINYVRREGNTFITAGTLRYPNRSRVTGRASSASDGRLALPSKSIRTLITYQSS